MTRLAEWLADHLDDDRGYWVLSAAVLVVGLSAGGAPWWSLLFGLTVVLAATMAWHVQVDRSRAEMPPPPAEAWDVLLGPPGPELRALLDEPHRQAVADRMTATVLDVLKRQGVDMQDPYTTAVVALTASTIHAATQVMPITHEGAASFVLLAARDRAHTLDMASTKDV